MVGFITIIIRVIIPINSASKQGLISKPAEFKQGKTLAVVLGSAAFYFHRKSSFL